MQQASNTYSPGEGVYEIRYGLLQPGDIPESFKRADWLNKLHEQQFQHYTRLEESVRREGFRNPVMCYEKHDGRTFPYGASRVYTAVKLGIAVPAFISDWVGTFKHFELITTVDQALTKFVDKPSVLEFHPQFGCQFWGCAHVHLSPEHLKQWTEYHTKQNTTHHFKRRMRDGQFYYADLGEKQSL